MKIYITGSHGFIGQNLVKRFPKRNIITISRSQLHNIDAMREQFELNPPMYIFHLSSYGNMADQTNEQEVVQANITNLNNLLIASKDYEYKSFINFSSSSVYGQKTHPMHETNSLEATSYYGVTKIAGELIVRAFVDSYKKPVASVRPFSIYGEGEAGFRFIPTLIRCIKKHEPMKLAPGMHDWVYIQDFIDALLLAQENIQSIKGKAVNIGTGVQYDNYDVLKRLCLIAKLNNPNTLPIEHIQSLRSYDSWVADNTLIKSMGWMPAHSFTEGLTNVWNSMTE